ncbi:hypothetical protein G9A89_019134 [Geosiphon pyriformis]|nr:hypothetical protein G9A89_019134 [Geosiphon pyriformis]
MGFENHEEKSESESEKETSKKTITRLVIGTSSQSRNQKTHDQEKELDIKEATFRNTQGNIILLSFRPISPPAENGDKMATPYIARLTDFSGKEEETDVHTWLREAQKAIQTNNWNNQRAIQTLPFFLKGTANLCKTVTQYLAQFNQIHRQIEVIEQGYYTDLQVLNQFIRGLKSSILRRVCPAYPNSLPETITLARAFELAEKKANHSQIINMIIEENKTKTLEKRVIQLGKELSKKIESYLILDPRRNITEMRTCHFCKCVGHLISQCQTQMMQKACENNYYAPPQIPRNQYTPIPCQYPTMYQNQETYQQQPMIVNPNWHSEAQNQPMWNQNVLVQKDPNRTRTNQQTNPNYPNY